MQVQVDCIFDGHAFVARRSLALAHVAVADGTGSCNNAAALSLASIGNAG